MSNAAKKLIAILLLTLVAIFISLPKEIPLKINLMGVKLEKTFTRPDLNINFGKVSINKKFDLVLGLDLAGGSHLVFEADLSSIPADRRETAITGVRNVIERRVNLFGVSEPNIQVSTFEGKERINVELPGVNNTKDAINLIGRVAFLTFAEVEGEGDKQTLKTTNLTGADLKSAMVVFDQTTGKPAVSLEFTSEGANKFEDLTGKNVGEPLPILLDGQLVSSPVVQEKISGGNAQITGTFTLDEAKNLAIQLNAGALPVPVKLVEQRTVGATLGAESIKASVKAGIVGLIMVLLFMVLSYGKLGLVADVALIIFGVLTLALYKLIPVVLTLPGIAGFLLSVGMAVDSNILIFERFKEERKRRPIYDALEVSFGRAWDSIRDANIATLVTAFILANPLDWSFLHTSGPVRGFAITLALGIGISLFTGIVVSRNLLRVFVKEKKT
ncbi:MAG TPA: protein translocase subunit SecD [Patescibacteria group bacterium]|nr:protein translocase subunit SecD [Patescibacteria group bacterium]